MLLKREGPLVASIVVVVRMLCGEGFLDSGFGMGEEDAAGLGVEGRWSAC